MTHIKTFTTNSFSLHPQVISRIIVVFVAITIVALLMVGLLGITFSKFFFIISVFILLGVVKDLKSKLKAELIVFDEGVRITLPFIQPLLRFGTKEYFLFFNDIIGVDQVDKIKGTLQLKTKDIEVEFCIPFDNTANIEILKMIKERVQLGPGREE